MCLIDLSVPGLCLSSILDFCVNFGYVKNMGRANFANSRSTVGKNEVTQLRTLRHTQIREEDKRWAKVDVPFHTLFFLAKNIYKNSQTTLHF